MLSEVQFIIGIKNIKFMKQIVREFPHSILIYIHRYGDLCAIRICHLNMELLYTMPSNHLCERLVFQRPIHPRTLAKMLRC